MPWIFWNFIVFVPRLWIISVYINYENRGILKETVEVYKEGS